QRTTCSKPLPACSSTEPRFSSVSLVSSSIEPGTYAPSRSGPCPATKTNLPSATMAGENGPMTAELTIASRISLPPGAPIWGTRAKHYQSNQGGTLRKLTAAAAAATTLALVLAAIAFGSGKTTIWTSPLSSGQEIPKQVVKDANAHGLFKATLKGTQLKWKLTFAKLTCPATSRNIH